MRDYYTILGITSDASFEEIKEAYRKLSKKIHPDVNGGDPFFEGMFIQIKEAYDVLSNEKTRQAYDLKKKLSKAAEINKRPPAKSSQEYYPLIYSFVCNQEYFFEGDILTFTWNCAYADYIQIIPFGYVDKLSGTANYRINNYKKRYLPVEIVAIDSKSDRQARQRIVLENGKYREFSESDKASTEKLYAKPELWIVSFVNPKGRLSKKRYLIYTLSLMAILGILFLFTENQVIAEFFQLVTLLFCYFFLVLTSKRIQDTGKNGILTLVMLIPYLNIVAFGLLIYLDGNKGANRYGYPVR